MSENTIQRCDTQQDQMTQSNPRRYQFAPAVDIVEHESAFELRADIPGALADQIEIQVERGMLKLSAPIAQPENGRKPLLQEYRVGDYVREFRIGEDIDTDSIEARLDHGTLTVRLPKAQALLPKKINVRTSE